MGRPSRQQIYAAVDRALSDLRYVGGMPLPVEAEGIWEDFWKEETHHSTAIEGNTLVQRQVKILLEEGRAVGNKELREYLEIEGYADAAKWVYQQAMRPQPEEHKGTLLNITEVREIHRLALAPAWDRLPPDGAHPAEGPGGFRRSEIEPLRPGLSLPTWSDVQPRIDAWLEQVNAGNRGDAQLHFFEWLGAMHAQFERIHPFRDGNGRVGRLLINLILVREAVPPAIILKRDRPKYLDALRRADAGDPGLLGELFARSVRFGIERRVLPALAGPKRLVPLQSLASKKVSRAALLSAARRDRLRTVKIQDELYSTREWVSKYCSSRQQGKSLTKKPPVQDVPEVGEQTSIFG